VYGDVSGVFWYWFGNQCGNAGFRRPLVEVVAAVTFV
jgi:hypothetical protein